MKFSSLNQVSILLGEDSPSKLGNLEGVRLQGLARADGSIQFISIHGSKAGNELEPIAKAIFAQLGNTNSFFAGKIIQVGEVITHRTPMQIPLKDDGKMSFEMETQYTLKSIEGDIASFDVNYSALVGAEVEAANINIQLIGDGKMTYSISNQYAPESTSNFSAQMNIPIYGGILKNVSTNRSRTVISYESKQISQRTAQ